MTMVASPVAPDILGVKIADRESVYEAQNYDTIKAALQHLTKSGDFFAKVQGQLGPVTGNIQLNIGIDGTIKVKQAGATEWKSISLDSALDTHTKTIQTYSQTALKALNGGEAFPTGADKTHFKQTYRKEVKAPKVKAKPTEPETTVKKASGIKPKGISGGSNDCWIKSLTQMLNLNPRLREKVVEKIFGKGHPLAKYGEIPSAQLRQAVIDAAPTAARKSDFKGSKQCDPVEALQLLLDKKDVSEIATPISTNQTVTTYRTTPSPTDRNPAIDHDTIQAGPSESSFLLPLHIGTHTKLEDMFSGYFETSHAARGAPLKAEDPKERITKEVRSFEKAPEQLMLQLNRFNRDPRTGTRTKISKEIEVPFEIDAKDHIIGKKEHKMALQSFIVHSGSIDSGHYVNYTKVDGQWYCMDEGTVAAVDKRHIKEAAKRAYLVYYEKATEVSETTETVRKVAEEAVENHKLLLEIIKGKHTEALSKQGKEGDKYRNLLRSSFEAFFPRGAERDNVLSALGKKEGIYFDKGNVAKQIRVGFEAAQKDPRKLIPIFQTIEGKIQEALLESSALIRDIDASTSTSDFEAKLKDLKIHKKIIDAYGNAHLVLDTAASKTEVDREAALKSFFVNIFENKVEQITKFISKTPSLATVKADTSSFNSLDQFIDYFKADKNKDRYKEIQGACFDNYSSFVQDLSKLQIYSDDQLEKIAKDPTLFNAVFFETERAEELPKEETLEKSFDIMMKSLGFNIHQASSKDRKDEFLLPDIRGSGPAYTSELVVRMSEWLHQDSTHFHKVAQMVHALHVKGMTDEIAKLNAALDEIGKRAPGLKALTDDLKLIIVNAQK